jgi:hypothetical protein
VKEVEMAPPRILRWLTAAVSLTAVAAGTVALHEQRAAEELARRCTACRAERAALADGHARLQRAQARYAGLRRRYEARVDEARRDEALLLAAYARAVAETQARVVPTAAAGA